MVFEHAQWKSILVLIRNVIWSQFKGIVREGEDQIFKFIVYGNSNEGCDNLWSIENMTLDRAG